MREEKDWEKWDEFKVKIPSYRMAQKECNTYDQYFQENEGENDKVVCIDAYRILFPAK